MKKHLRYFSIARLDANDILCSITNVVEDAGYSMTITMKKMVNFSKNWLACESLSTALRINSVIASFAVLLIVAGCASYSCNTRFVDSAGNHAKLMRTPWFSKNNPFPTEEEISLARITAAKFNDLPVIPNLPLVVQYAHKGGLSGVLFINESGFINQSVIIFRTSIISSEKKPRHCLYWKLYLPYEVSSGGAIKDVSADFEGINGSILEIQTCLIHGIIQETGPHILVHAFIDTEHQYYLVYVIGVFDTNGACIPMPDAFDYCLSLLEAADDISRPEFWKQSVPRKSAILYSWLNKIVKDTTDNTDADYRNEILPIISSSSWHTAYEREHPQIQAIMKAIEKQLRERERGGVQGHHGATTGKGIGDGDQHSIFAPETTTD